MKASGDFIPFAPRSTSIADGKIIGSITRTSWPEGKDAILATSHVPPPWKVSRDQAVRPILRRALKSSGSSPDVTRIFKEVGSPSLCRIAPAGASGCAAERPCPKRLWLPCPTALRYGPTF